MPPGSLIVGVDLAPIKPIPRCITFQSDITTDKCRATLRQHLKTLKADTVLHDGAPNVGTAWVQDAFSQAELVLQSLRLATDFLAPGGNFITKIFRSKDYNSLLWVFNQLFNKVEATKPPSSRNVSAEIFVVCREYKAPKKVDPRFLDAKTVFAELADAKPNHEAKVFNPEVKKRKREGYAEGDYTQFKEVSVTEFVETMDPIAVLGGSNKINLEERMNEKHVLAAVELERTSLEVRLCCNDLKVLGRKEFKSLLRWRLKIRDRLKKAADQADAEAAAAAGEPAAGEEVAEVVPMDEEMRIQEEMQKIRDQADSKKKKEKRRENERKTKEIVRMQMNMTTPMEIGMDQAGPYGEDSMFALRTADKINERVKLTNGRMHTVVDKEDSSDSEDEYGSDEDGDNLEGQLDDMYSQYQERKAATDAKYRAKKARTEHSDDEFEDFSDREERDGSSDDEVLEDENDDLSDGEEDASNSKPLFHDPASAPSGQSGLSKRAAMFFEQDIFQGITGMDDLTHDDSGIEMGDSDDSNNKAEVSVKPAIATKTAASAAGTPRMKVKPAEPIVSTETANDEDDDSFEVVKATTAPSAWTANSDPSAEPTKNGRPDVDIITAEAMTLAHALATGTQTRHSLLDDSFNKYTLRDVDGLPDWFLDDENQHSKLQRPITAAAAAAIKEKMRALNARPIKKVQEAKDRKKFRAARRLEKLKKKSAMLAEDEDVSEKDKANGIAKMMAKAAKKKPKQKVTVVVAGGHNKGGGRPRGVKGKYIMKDARMKKDVRGLKRAAKRNGK